MPPREPLPALLKLLHPFTVAPQIGNLPAHFPTVPVIISPPALRAGG